MAIMDFFMVSPGDKKRADLELESRKKLLEAETAQRKEMLKANRESEFAVRDSNQLSSDVNRHKQEREMQSAIADTLTTTDSGFDLSPEQEQSMRMIDASKEMSKIKAMRPMAEAAQAGNAYTTAQAIQPTIPETVKTGAEAQIAGNQASTANALRKRSEDQARMTTAGPRAGMMDTADTEHAKRAMEEVNIDRSLDPVRNMAMRKRYESQAAGDAYTTATTAGLDPQIESDSKKAQFNAQTAIANQTVMNPGMARQFAQDPWQLRLMQGNIPAPSMSIQNAPPANIQRRKVGSLNQ